MTTIQTKLAILCWDAIQAYNKTMPSIFDTKTDADKAFDMVKEKIKTLTRQCEEDIYKNSFDKQESEGK